MYSNILPEKAGDIIQLGPKMADGIVEVGASVPVVMVTAEQVTADTDAFNTANYNFDAGRSKLQDASNAYQLTLVPLYSWLLEVKNMLASVFGTRWTTSWAQAGFIDNTTAIPNTIAGRMSLAMSLVQFFRDNPGYEVPTMKLTKKEGDALIKAVQEGQKGVRTAKAVQKTVGDAWTLAHDKVIATMTELLRNLEAKLSDFDIRWLNFGLQIPATITTPAQPQNLTVELSGDGVPLGHCDPVPNATRYRFRQMIVGAETKFSLVASATEPMALLPEVLPGQTVRTIVQAVSGSLQGVASEPVDFTMPLLAEAKAAEPAKPAVRELPLAAANGNSSNGHTNGSRRHARVA